MVKDKEVIKMGDDRYDYFSLTRKEYAKTAKTGILNYGKLFGGPRRLLRVSKFQGQMKMPSGFKTYGVAVKKRRKY